MSLAASTLLACGRTEPVRVAAAQCIPAQAMPAGITRHSLDEAGIRRDFLVHVPPGYDGTARTPVVFLFHGLGGDPARLLKTTHMAALADKNGFIVVAPQGLGKVAEWDFRTPATAPDSDLRAVRDMVSEVKKGACVDSSRVYAAGFSNGSALTLALACDGSVPFAAYGAVSGPFIGTSCSKAPPASIIYFHGMNDSVVPFDGADTAIGRLPAASTTLAEWQGRDGCLPTDSTTTVTQRVRHFAWSSCNAGTSVEMYAVANGGHRWPGGETSAPVGDDGVTPHDIDASALIWRFFERHPRGGQSRGGQ